MDTSFFDGKKVVKVVENENSVVYTVTKVGTEAFELCKRDLEDKGFEKKEEYTKPGHLYAAYLHEDTGVFLNFFENIGKLTVVEEQKCIYFARRDMAGEMKFAPQITQLHLEDFGMSYIIRLGDGRFIVIDGGWKLEPDIERLYSFLKKSSCGDIPVIAAWIMSHPHSDHYHCFIGFSDKYADEVKIESFILNFPEADDLEHYPALTYDDSRFSYDTSEQTNIPLMYERMALYGAPIYTARTGQIYDIGDARCEILACMDDTIHRDDNINASSLIIRTELGGQIIIWATDASFSAAELPEKYGEYLRADILQVPHHGFQSGDAESEIRGYDLIRPSVCFMSTSDYNAFTKFCTFRKGTRHLIRDVGIDEMITGEEDRTVTLPYTAVPWGKKDLERKYLDGLDACGTRTWIFTDLCAARREDFCFTVLNTANFKAELNIDIFFPERGKEIRHIKATVPPDSMRGINIIDPADVNGNANYFNWAALSNTELPNDSAFAVRFIANIPIVVSHKEHTAAFHGSNR